MSKEYEVGYKKPPAHTRFQNGQSGNPAGRPKMKPKIPSIDAAIIDALNARVTVTENGMVRQITKFDAAFKQLANKAASGHMPSLKLLMPLLTKISDATEGEAMAQENEKTRERLKERFARLAKGLRWEEEQSAQNRNASPGSGESAPDRRLVRTTDGS